MILNHTIIFEIHFKYRFQILSKYGVISIKWNLFRQYSTFRLTTPHSLTIHPPARHSTKKTRAKNLHNIHNVIKALFITHPQKFTIYVILNTLWYALINFPSCPGGNYVNKQLWLKRCKKITVRKNFIVKVYFTQLFLSMKRFRKLKTH